MKKISVITMLVLLTTVSTPVGAETMPIYDLPAIDVQAAAQMAALADADTVITVSKINIGKAQTVPELLRGTAGIQVQDRPNSGGNEDLTVKLRGHDSRHYTVLVDGVPMAMAGVMGGGYIDWNAIPLNMVDRIEIIKSAKSVAYGGTGGVINIVTKKDTSEGGEMQLTTGTNGRRQYLINYGGTVGKLGMSLYANRAVEDAYLRNSEYKNEQIGLNLQYALSETSRLKINIDHNDLKEGLVVANIPGQSGYNSYYPITLQSDTFASGKGTVGDGSYSEAHRNNYTVSWESKRDNGSNNTLTYWKNYENRHEVEYGPNGLLYFDRRNITDKSSGINFTGAQKMDDKHVVGYGVDYKWLRYGYGYYDYNYIGASALYPSQKINTLGAYIEDTWNMGNRWVGNGGIRYDSMRGDRDAEQATDIGSMNDSSLSPKINFTFKNNASTTTAFSINHIWRAPSMAEFYWYYAGFGMAANQNLGLEPEKGWGYETSVDHQINKKLKTKVTVYYQNMDNWINFTHTRPFNCYNIHDVKLWGFEWENTYQINNNSHLFLNYANQHTKKDGVSSWDNVGLRGELDYRPRYVVSFGYGLDKASWHLKYDMMFTSHQAATLGYPATNPSSYNSIHLGGYVVHNISLTKDIGNKESVNVSVYNIFDKDYCEIW